MSIADKLREAAGDAAPISSELALELLGAAESELPGILEAATIVRRARFGDEVHLCSIANARSGACSEDCAFCAQSSCHDTNAATFGLKPASELLASYEESSQLPISHFGLVTSGRGGGRAELDRVRETISGRSDGATWCASLGCLDVEALTALKDAGLKRFHHNLETAESFFPEICTTHSYAARLATVRAVKAAGLELCCGGIFGMGESHAQRVELAMTLKEEQVDAIPLNFLVPIPGTPLAHLEALSAPEILRTVAMFRLTNPTAEIKVCGGRAHLGDMQDQIFAAGATGMMIGPLLTIAGRDAQEDLRMVEALGMKIAGRE